MNEFSDLQVFTRIKNGDETAFNRLFGLYYTVLCHFASKYVSDLDLSRSLVQQVFVDLWIKRDSLEVNYSLKSYLYNSVRNRAIDHLRITKDKVEISDAIKNSYHAPFRDLVEEAELNDRINKSINKLPEKCREIFILCRYDGLKYSEIAEKLGISIKTVEMQMGIALKRIRRYLSENRMVNLVNFVLSIKN